jgi:hypothetical protein
MKRFLQSIAAFSIAFLIGYTFTPIPESVMAQISPPWNSGGSSNTPTANTITTATTCVDAGANDTYACDLPTAPTYSNGFWAAFQANTANTGAATINFNSVGPLTIKRKTTAITTDLVTGDIRADQWVLGFYDGTNFQCVSCDGSVAYYNTANTWAASQTFGSGAILTTNSGFVQLGTTGATSGAIILRTSQTPDSPMWETGTLSNCVNMIETADSASDFNNGAAGTSASTDPCINIHSAVADTTQYKTLAAWGQAGGSIKTLTAGAATALVRIPIAQSAGTGGSLRYTVYASEAAEFQIREGEIKFAVVNKAGTETCTVSAASEAADGSVVAVSSGTLTYGITCTSNAADTVDLEINAVSSLTETTLRAYYFVTLVGPGQPARQ